MKTIEYHGVVRRVLAGRAEVEIESVSAVPLEHDVAQTGRVVSVRCMGRALRTGEKVFLTETIVDERTVMLFGLFLPVLMCVAIYLVFRQVTQDGRLSMAVAAIFLFPYYSVLLLMMKYFRKEHAFRLK